jgi:phosphatidylserine/phosphatidylglycerophosphate/cardiolipin synthase-like enzyme
MVIDDLIVVAGSFNYTQPADEFNDEHILVLGSTHAEFEGWNRSAGETSAGLER